MYPKHLRNPAMLRSGTDFLNSMILPLRKEFEKYMDILPISRHTAWLHCNGHFLFVPFLILTDDLTQREKIHYEELAKQGWATVIVVWGLDPDCARNLQVFDANGAGEKIEARVKDTRKLVRKWWKMANETRPPQTDGPSKVIRVISKRPLPKRNDPIEEWDFVKILGTFCKGDVHAKDVDAGFLIGGNVFIIEEKTKRADLDTASKIAFTRLCRYGRSMGIGVLKPNQKEEIFMEGRRSEYGYYGPVPLREDLWDILSCVLFESIVLNIAPLEQRMKVSEHIQYEVIRANRSLSI